MPTYSDDFVVHVHKDMGSLEKRPHDVFKRELFCFVRKRGFGPNLKVYVFCVYSSNAVA